jgi:hypothetical protein
MGLSALMFLHRHFFKRALTINPTDPLNSVYSHSFSTTYKSACAILDSTINQYADAKCFVPRVWRIWTNAFCAAVGNVLRVAQLNLNLFLGHNWNRGHIYPKRKFRTTSPSETGGCMYCIRQRIQSQHLCIEGTCMYSCGI